MAVLYDDKGQPQEIPDNQVIEALKSGQYGLHPDTKSLNLVDPTTGGIHAVPVGDLPEYTNNGWVIETSDEQRDRELQEDYGDLGDQAVSALAGAARGFSFGVSDWLLTESGVVAPETLKAYEEANPIASMGGELTAIGASILASGGAAGAGILKNLGAAPRGVAKLGMKAEAKVAEALAPMADGSLFGRMAAKAASVGAGGAIEGAVYSGGRFITETSFGDIDATVDNLVSQVSMGTLLGGGFGAGLGFGLTGVGAAGRAAGRFTKKHADSLVNLWSKETGNTPVRGLADKVYDWLRKPAKAILPDDAKAGIDELADATKRARAARDADKVLDEHAVKAAKIDDEILADEDLVTSHWRELKPDEMKRLAKEYRSDLPAGMEDVGMAEVDTMLDVVDESINKMLSADVGLYAKTPEMKRLAGRMKEKSFRIDKAAQELGETDYMGEVFSVLDATKRDVGRIAKKLGRAQANPDVVNSLDELQGLYGKLMKSLEKKEIWGKMAESQTGINRAFHKYLAAKAYRSKNKLYVAWEEKPMFQGKTYATDPGGYKGLWRNTGKAENLKDEEFFAKQWDSRAELVAAMRKHLKWDSNPKKFAKEIAAAERVAKNSNELRKLDALARDDIGLINQLEDIKRASGASGFGSAGLGALGGLAVGGPVGALVGGAAGLVGSAITSPEKVIRILSTLERVAKRNQVSVERSVSKYVNFAAKGQKIKRFVAPASVGSMRQYFGGKDNQEAYQNASKKLTAFAADPEGAARKLEQSTEAFSEAAPTVATKIMKKGMLANSFLLSKLPQSPHRASVWKKDYKPSDVAITKFEKYLKATFDPKSVLQDLENGTLSSEGVEAVATLYPELYKRMVFQLTENIDKLQKLPYQSRIQLSVMFDVPLDPTMEPSFVAAMQQNQTRPDPAGVAAPQRAINRGRRGPDPNLSASQRLSQKG